MNEQDENIDAENTDMIFEIPKLSSVGGKVYQDVKCRAIYTAKDQFYDELKVATHINFLKKQHFNSELKKFNLIWANHDFFKKGRKFKVLKSRDNKYFLRSIVSDKYREYGTCLLYTSRCV